MLWAMSDAKDSQTSTTHTKPAGPMPMLDDEPILSHETDRLGVLQYADVIAGTALGTVGPFTIGVFGGWGEGKTSILRAAESRLNERATTANATGLVKDGDRHHPHMITVWFNAWQFEREAHPIVPLVASIQKAVIARITQDRTILEKTGEAGKRFFWNLVEGGGKLFSGLKATLPATMTGVEMELEGANVVDAVETLFKGDSNANTNALTRAIDASLGMAVFDEMSRLGSQANDRPAAPGWGFPRVVVFVDDLDRCTPDKAFELIEAIKVSFAQPGFIFVLALNRDVVDVYVRAMWKKRLEADHPSLIRRYLDKIIQLPLYVRSHQQAFGGFVSSRLEMLKQKGVHPDTMAVLESVKDHLGETTAHSPRALVRRINTLLIDQRLRPDSSRGLVVNGHTLTDAQYVGLCLVQRTVLDYLRPDEIKGMSDDTTFCEKLSKQDRGNAKSTAHALQDFIDTENRIEANESIQEPRNEDHEQERKRWAELLLPIWSTPPIAYVLSQDFGKLWLASQQCRTLVADYVATSPERAMPISESVARSSSPDVAVDPADRESVEQRALVERAIRKALNIAGDAEVPQRLRSTITALSFSFSPLTDVGVAILLDRVSSLASLTDLDLSSTKITDTALRLLASTGSTPQSLYKLTLDSTAITDEGLKVIAAPSSALRTLRTLDVDEAKGVSDAGLAALAAPDTALTMLRDLWIGNTTITGKGVERLASPSSGLRSLTALFLGGLEITDENIEVFAAPGSSLVNLGELGLLRTKVTNRAVFTLSGAASSLKNLTGLWLADNTDITDDIVSAFEDERSPLRLLRSLDLEGTKVTGQGADKIREMLPNIRIKL